MGHRECLALIRNGNKAGVVPLFDWKRAYRRKIIPNGIVGWLEPELHPQMFALRFFSSELYSRCCESRSGWNSWFISEWGAEENWGCCPSPATAPALLSEPWASAGPVPTGNGAIVPAPAP